MIKKKKLLIPKILGVFFVMALSFVFNVNMASATTIASDSWYKDAHYGFSAGAVTYYSTTKSSYSPLGLPASVSMGNIAYIYMWIPKSARQGNAMYYNTPNITANTPSTDYRTITITNVTSTAKAITGYACYEIKVTPKKPTTAGIDVRLNRPDGTRYCTISGLIINKGNATLNKPALRSGLTYNGQEQVLCTGGSAVNGKFYVGATTNKSNTSTISWKESSSLVKVKNAGTYYIYAKANTSNATLYNSINPTYIGAVSIAKKQLAISHKDTTFTYDGNKKTPTVDVVGLVSGEKCNVVLEYPEIKYADNYTVSVNGVDNTNYVIDTLDGKSFSTNKGFSVKVNPLTATLKWTNTSKVYDGKILTPKAEVTNLCGKDTCVVSVKGTDSAKIGAYKVYAYKLSNSNYALGSNNYVQATITSAILKTQGENNSNTITITSSESTPSSKLVSLKVLSIESVNSKKNKYKIKLSWKKLKYKKKNAKFYKVYKKTSKKWKKVKKTKKTFVKLTISKKTKIKIIAYRKKGKKSKKFKTIYKTIKI